MRIQLILQTETAECSLACLAMVASAFGMRTGLRELRAQFTVSSKGATLKGLIANSAALGFNARPLRIELVELASLKIPAILHWRLNHFVVLKKCSARHVTILDPSIGERTLTLAEFSDCFTGVAVELTPTSKFQPKRAPVALKVSQLTGSVRGLPAALFHIFLVAAVLEVFALAAPLFNQLIVDEVLTSGDRELLDVIVLGFALLLVVQSAVSLARSWMLMVLGQTVSLQWNSNMFSHLIRLPVSFFARRHLGDITSRFGSLTAIQKTLTTSVIEALLDGIMGIAALVAMYIYAWQLASMTVVAVVAYALLRLGSYRLFKGAAGQKLVLTAQQNSHFLETLRAITPIKLFGREEERRIRWQNLQVDIQNRDIVTAKMNILYTGANTLIFGIENLAVFWYGAKLIMTVRPPNDAAFAPFTVGMLFAYISYKSQFTQRVSSMINYSVELRMLNLQSDRLADIALSLPEQDNAGVQGFGKDLPASDLDHLKPSLELRKASFKYGDGEAWILKDADLNIQAGKSVAIVGPSGVGKTTLVKVLMGLLQPIQGEVLFGGCLIRHLGIHNYRHQLGSVMQDDSLLSGSLSDNISFFDVAKDESWIRQVAGMAQIANEIDAMPMGFQTLIGDLGSGMSGGQKQRLLLARALYKKPKILILDEATSHLDIENERAVMAVLAQSGCTRIIIAHRPETIALTDEAYILKGGRFLKLHRPAKPEESAALNTLVA